MSLIIKRVRIYVYDNNDIDYGNLYFINIIVNS